jgi:DNA polymerase-3 subunit epsilon
MLLLGLDFETTWEDPVDTNKNRITEIGAVLYDWDKKQPIQIYNELVHDDDYPASPPEIVELTGITDEMLNTWGVAPKAALATLNGMMMNADFVVAHNGSLFDKPLYKAECIRHGKDIVDKTWIDTRTDVEFPKHIKARKLTHLAAEHGFANPFSHRAVFDVLTMMKILGEYNIHEVIELAAQPLIHSVAVVSFQKKDLAKARGYYWDGDKKNWFKPMKEGQFIKECNEAPFECRKVELGE